MRFMSIDKEDLDNNLIAQLNLNSDGYNDNGM